MRTPEEVGPEYEQALRAFSNNQAMNTTCDPVESIKRDANAIRIEATYRRLLQERRELIKTLAGI